MNFAGRIEAQVVIPAGGASVSATNTGGTHTATVAAGSYFPAALVAAFVAALQASAPPSSGAWSGSISLTTTSATGKVTFNCTGSWSLTWSSTTLRDALGFTANISSTSSAQTGTKQSPMVWFPDAPLDHDLDTKRAPLQTDLRSTQSPQGSIVSVVGTSYLQHGPLRWMHVPRARIWEAEAAVANASWEAFLKNTQLGQGSISWFSPSSKVQVYDDAENQLGADASVTGWQITGITGIGAAQQIAGFTGWWRVDVPLLVSGG